MNDASVQSPRLACGSRGSYLAVVAVAVQPVVALRAMCAVVGQLSGLRLEYHTAVHRTLEIA